jgi:hypothetical protein
MRLDIAQFQEAGNFLMQTSIWTSGGSDSSRLMERPSVRISR